MSTKSFFNKIKGVAQELNERVRRLDFCSDKLGAIADATTAFVALIISTVMRMGCGIFEYSRVSLLLNGLIYSLITGAVFIKTGVITRDRQNFSNTTIKKIFISVAITNAIAYPLIMFADRQKCLSSSIMFIDFFVFVVLLVSQYIFSRKTTIRRASDILVGSPKHISDLLSKNRFGTSRFNPIGVISTEETNYSNSFQIQSLGLSSDISSILHSLDAKGIVPKRFVIVDPITSDKITILKEYANKNGIILLQVFSSEFEN